MKRCKAFIVTVCVFALLAMTGLLTACAGNGHTHDLTYVKESDATCTQDGNSSYYKCDECGKLFSDAEATNEVTLESVTIQKLGHDIKHYDAQPASCTENGNIECYACSRCGTCFTDEAGTTVSDVEFVVKATGHDDPMAFTEAKDPTVENAGNVAYYHCSKCNKNFADAYGDKEISDTVIAPLEKIDEVTVALNGYKEGQNIDLNGKSVAFSGPYSLSSSGTVTDNSVVLTDVYALKYSIVCDGYVGTIIFENGKTEYEVRLEYPYATDTSNSDTGRSNVDLSHMNDVNHTIKLSDAWGATTKNYTEAKLNLPTEIKNEKYVTASFTLRYSQLRFDNMSRFGVKMAGDKGVFVSVFGKEEMQVCVFGRDDADDTFKGYDNKNNAYAEKASKALLGDGMKVRMLRANEKIRMFVNLDNEWIEFINYQGVATCAASAETDIRFLILAHDWEISDIKYAIPEHEAANPPTLESTGNLEYYKVGDMYFNVDGTLTTKDELTLRALTPVAATLTVKGYKDGVETPITGNVVFKNDDNGQNKTVTVENGSAAESLYALTYDVTFGDYRGTVTIEDGKTTYDVLLQYAYATESGVSNTGNSRVDLSKMNDKNHTVKMSDVFANTTANYTEVTLKLPDDIKNGKQTSASFTLKHVGGDVDTQANLARFGVKMAGGKGVYAFVNYEKTSVMANVFNDPIDMFKGEHEQSCDVNAFIGALTGNDGMRVRVVRFGTAIRMLVNYNGSWVQLNQTATCEENAETEIRLLILAHEWEFSNIEYSLIEHVVATPATEGADGCLEHYKVGDAYFTADGMLSSKEAVTLPRLVKVNASLTVNGYKDGTETPITGSVKFINADNNQNVSVNVTNGAASANLYAMTYEVTYDDYYFGTVTVAAGMTEYTVVLRYAYATDTSDSKTGNSSIDFSKMNDNNHTIKMSDTFNPAQSTANYTEAKLNLPNDVKNSNKTSVSFTLKHLGSFAEPHTARFGVKMSGEKGIFVSMHADRMQVCAFTKPDNMFDGHDNQNTAHTTAVRNALESTDGLQVRVVRFGATIRMFVKLNGTWVQFNQTATCEESAATDIRLLILAHEWEFSNIEYSVLEHVKAKPATTSEEGNSEYYKVGDMFFKPDGTLTTADKVILPVITTVEANLTVKLYKEGQKTDLTGEVRFVNAENQKDFTVSVTGGTATYTFDALTYQLTYINGNDKYIGTVTVALDKPSYEITLDYEYAMVTHTHTNGDGSSTVDLSKMNDSNHTIKMNDNLSFEGTDKYTEAKLNLPDNVKNAKNAEVTFTLKYLGSGFNNLSRFGVKMAGECGIHAFVTDGNLNADKIKHGTDEFDGNNVQSYSADDFINALMGNDGLQVRVVRNGANIYMLVKLNGVWVRLTPLATCNESDETDIRLLILAHEWEFSNIEYSATTGANVTHLGHNDTASVDLSKCDTDKTIKISDTQFSGTTANYTEVQLVLPDEAKRAKNVTVTFTLKHIGGDFNSQANLARFGVKMAGGKGVYSFVNYEKTAVMANGFNNPDNMFDGESGQSCDKDAFINALMGNDGLQVRVVRNGANIYMLVKLNGVWVRLTPLATCNESDETDIRLLILAHEWEFSNIEYSATTGANVTHLGNEDAAWVDLTKYDNDKTITLTDMKWNGTDKYTEVQLILPENVKSAKNVEITFTIKCVNDQAFNWGDPLYGNSPNLGRFGVKMAENKGIFTYVNTDNKNIIEASAFNNPNNMFDGGGEVGQTGNAFLTAIQGGGLQVKVTRNGGTISMAIYLNDEWITFSKTATCDENAETDIRLLTMAFGWELSGITVTVPNEA